MGSRYACAKEAQSPRVVCCTINSNTVLKTWRGAEPGSGDGVDGAVVERCDVGVMTDVYPMIVEWIELPYPTQWRRVGAKVIVGSEKGVQKYKMYGGA